MGGAAIAETVTQAGNLASMEGAKVVILPQGLGYSIDCDEVWRIAEQVKRETDGEVCYIATKSQERSEITTYNLASVQELIKGGKFVQPDQEVMNGRSKFVQSGREL
jgi:hypothetical protein